MLHTTNTLIDICDVEITNTKGDFTINTEVSKVHRAELILIPNPHCDEDIIQTYTHLQGIKMEDRIFTSRHFTWSIRTCQHQSEEGHQSWAKRRTSR